MGFGPPQHTMRAAEADGAPGVPAASTRHTICSQRALSVPCCLTVSLPVMVLSCLLAVQVSAEFARVLEGFGFTVNSMGGETRLDLATYNFTGGNP